MRIAIAGAGICGAYLYRRFRNNGYDPDIYDIEGVNSTPGCGIASCAWFAPDPEIFDFIEKAGLYGDDYILDRINKMVFAGIDLNVKMVTIDKPKLIRDLINTEGRTDLFDDHTVGENYIKYSPIDKSQYDIIIDATGTARAYLGHAPNLYQPDIIGDGLQIRATVEKYPQGMSHIMPVKGGYLWVFPIGKNQVHAGIATHTPQQWIPVDILNLIKPIVGEPHFLQCMCRSKVRVTGPVPPYYVKGVQAVSSGWKTPSIYGVGEAIGIVSPLTGEGMVPGLRSCEIFYNHFRGRTLDLYRDDINSAFSWIFHERSVLDRIMKTGRPGITDLPVLRTMLLRCHCKAPLWSLYKILQKMLS